jgi:hypothetical protein
MVKETIRYLREIESEVPVDIQAKRGEFGQNQVITRSVPTVPNVGDGEVIMTLGLDPEILMSVYMISALS